MLRSSTLNYIFLQDTSVCKPLQADGWPQSWSGCHPDSIRESHPGPLDLHPPQEVSVPPATRSIQTRRPRQPLLRRTKEHVHVPRPHDGQPRLYASHDQRQYHHSAARHRQIHTAGHREPLRDLKRTVRADLWKSAAAAHTAGRSMQRQRRGCRRDLTLSRLSRWMKWLRCSGCIRCAKEGKNHRHQLCLLGGFSTGSSTIN